MVAVLQQQSHAQGPSRATTASFMGQAMPGHVPHYILVPPDTRPGTALHGTGIMAPILAGPGGLVVAPGSDGTVPGVGAGAGAPPIPAALTSSTHSVQELVHGAASILGSTPLSIMVMNDGSGNTSPARHASPQRHPHGGPGSPDAVNHPAGPSPAVVAALEGRTMLKMASLPGRYFAREIPSSRGQPTAARQAVWRVAAKLAAEGGGASAKGPGPGPGGGTQQGATSLTALVAAASNGGAAAGAGGAAGTVKVNPQPSGLLTRFALHTMANLTNSGRHRTAASLRPSEQGEAPARSTGGGGPPPQQQHLLPGQAAVSDNGAVVTSEPPAGR